MKAFQNDDETLFRKSSVYNQTGETYFQQLSAYNRMSAHLRRVLLAPCVVDCQNKRYVRDKTIGRGGSSTNRSKSLDKIRTCGNIIDGIAYDTEHHPLDVLRMNLECNLQCPGKVKRVIDTCTGCNDSGSRSRVGQTSGIVAGKISINSDEDETICPCLRSRIVKKFSTSTPKRESVKSSRLIGNQMIETTIADRGEWTRNSRDKNRTTRPNCSKNNVEETEPLCSYDSTFESSSETSSIPVSPIRNERDNRVKNTDPIDRYDRQTNKFSENFQLAEDAKYAKFICDVTREIMNDGLYTDDELRAVFKKHIDINSDNLDRNKMQSEIYQLGMSLNVPTISVDDKDDNDEDEIEGFVGSGRFAKFSAEKPPTPPKILDDNKLAEKLQNQEDAMRYGDNRSRRNSHGKNTVVLVDANPEFLITERDVLLTLVEMKLEPRQIQTICKSLQNKSRETVVSQTVQVNTEAPYSREKQDRANSPMNSRNVSRSSDLYNSHRDRTVQTARPARRTQICQCHCRENFTNVRYSSEHSQTEIRPEMTIRTTTNVDRDDKNRIASRSASLFGISGITVRSRSIGSSESKKNYETSVIDETRSKEGRRSREFSSGREKGSREISRATTRLGSIKDRRDRSEEIGDEKLRDKKINSRRSTSTSQSENIRETNKSRKSRESQKENERKTSRMNDERRSTTGQRRNRSDVDSFVKNRENEEKPWEKKTKMSGGKITSMRDEDEDENPLILKTKRDSEKGERKNSKRTFTSSRDSSVDDGKSNVAFVSHSEFLNNLERDEAVSLPDISERSEAIEEDLESDEISTVASQTTPKPSRVEDADDNESDDMSEKTYHVDVIADAKKKSSASTISKDVDNFRERSTTSVAKERRSRKETLEVEESDDNDENNGLSQSEETEDDNNENDRLSHSSNNRNSDYSDTDDDKIVVVGSTKSASSSISIVKKLSSRINRENDEKRKISDVNKTSISSKSTRRSSSSRSNEIIKAKTERKFETNDENDEDENSKNFDDKLSFDARAKKTRMEKNRRTSSKSDDKTDDATSIGEELDRLEISNSEIESSSEMRIRKSANRGNDEMAKSESRESYEDRRRSYKFDEHSDRSSMSINRISKSGREIYRGKRDSDRSDGNLEEEEKEEEEEENEEDKEEEEEEEEEEKEEEEEDKEEEEKEEEEEEKEEEEEEEDEEEEEKEESEEEKEEEEKEEEKEEEEEDEDIKISTNHRKSSGHSKKNLEAHNEIEISSKRTSEKSVGSKYLRMYTTAICSSNHSAHAKPKTSR